MRLLSAFACFVIGHSSIAPDNNSQNPMDEVQDSSKEYIPSSFASAQDGRADPNSGMNVNDEISV